MSRTLSGLRLDALNDVDDEKHQINDLCPANDSALKNQKYDTGDALKG